MEAVAYSNFRKSLKDYFKQVNSNSEPLIVTNKDSADNVVIMSKSDYDAIMETLSINSNDYLMQKIAKGDQEFAEGNFRTHELLEDSDDD